MASDTGPLPPMNRSENDSNACMVGSASSMEITDTQIHATPTRAPAARENGTISIAVLVVPMLAPTTNGAAARKLTPPSTMALMAMAIGAALDCISVALSAPAPSSSSSLAKVAPVASINPSDDTSGAVTGRSRFRPASSRPKPAMKPPSSPRRPRPISRHSAPSNSMGMNHGNHARPTPVKATNHEVLVVPTVAPATMPMAAGNATNPAAAKPMVARIVALLACMATVMPTPSTMPVQGPPTLRCSNARSASPLS